MSVACLRVGLRVLTVTYICISTALSSKVVWKSTGESITIQCKFTKSEARLISVKKGLAKNEDFFYKSKSSSKVTFADPGRSQVHGDFPNLQILLNDLTTNDTGVFWCLYQVYDKTGESEMVEGEGSLLLVVKDPADEVKKSTLADPPCTQPDQNLVIISVVISAIVLLTIISALVLFVFRKVNNMRVEKKTRPVPLNDVYEDMRGTLRR